MASSVVTLPQNTQYGQEEIEDVQVESHGCEDVFVICETLDEIVGIIDYVSAEHQRADSSIYCNRGRAKREEHLHEAGHYKNDEAGEENGSKEAEVFSFLCSPESVCG